MTDYDNDDHRKRKNNRVNGRKRRDKRPRKGEEDERRSKDRSRSPEAREKSSRARFKRRRSASQKAYRKSPVASKVVEPKPPRDDAKRKEQTTETRVNESVNESSPKTETIVVTESFETVHRAGDCPHRQGYCNGELAWEFSDGAGHKELRCEGYLRTLHWDA